MTDPIEGETINYVVALRKVLSAGEYKIYINATMVDEDLQNKLIKVQMPVVSSTSQNTTAPTTKYKDLKRIEHIFTIQGQIRYQKATIAGAQKWLTAAQAKNALIFYILYTSGNIEFYWSSVAKPTAKPNQDVDELMESNVSDRYATTVFDKIKFGDPAITKYRTYSASKYTYLSQDEVSPAYFNLNMTLTRGKKFGE